MIVRGGVNGQCEVFPSREGERLSIIEEREWVTREGLANLHADCARLLWFRRQFFSSRRDVSGVSKRALNLDSDMLVTVKIGIDSDREHDECEFRGINILEVIFCM